MIMCVPRLAQQAFSEIRNHEITYCEISFVKTLQTIRQQFINFVILILDFSRMELLPKMVHLNFKSLLSM